MAANLDLLVPELKTKIAQLVNRCADRGFTMRPSAGFRDPFEQAKLWRQSRSIEEIRAMIKELRAAGADFLAYCIESVGPQHGDPVTNAIPGYSWHQWGEAVDCFWLLNGKAEWSTTKLVGGFNAYRVYAQDAVKVGLFAGGNWTRLKDWPHVQLRPDASPAKIMSVSQVNSTMKSNFGS
jgi:peptidoglycan L-alanyl-D-glutamate endopeptidase CwlK